MRKLERLRKEALISCNSRGHKMNQFNRTYRHWWGSACSVCGKMVNLNDDPLPNEIAIGGSAVALSCGD